jgi:outer membrane lipoprotein-sorting protein
VQKVHLIILIVFTACYFILFEGPYPAAASATDVHPELKLARIIKNIKEKEKTLKTFAATFVQTKKSQLLRETLNSEGFIYFDSRGKMLIKVTLPSPLTLLLKQNMILIHFPESDSVERKIFGRMDNIIKEYLGLGESVETLKAKYDIRLSGETASGSYHLTMIPKIKTTSRYIEMIHVVVSPKNWLPEQIHLKEKQGDYTSLRLRFSSINEPLPRDIFSIELPEDEDR